MNGESRWRTSGRVRSWSRTRLAAWSTAAGATLALATVIVSALDAVSAQQAIAMALPAGLTTVGGLIRTKVPDAWAAWRRGFQHGSEAAVRCQPRGQAGDVTVKAFRESRLASSPVAGHHP
jgi:uncharacterized membrane protein